MALKQKQNDIPLPARGNVPARLARIIEIGEHETKFGIKDQVVFYYSLPTRIIDLEGSDFHGRQSLVKTFNMTMSTSEKSNLVEDHIDVLDPNFDLSAEVIDLSPLLTRPIYVQLEHNEGADGRVYCNIVNTMGVPEGMEVGELDTTPWHFDFDNPDPDVWTKYMSDFIKEKIQSARNYKGSAVESMVMKLEAMSGKDENPQPAETNTQGVQAEQEQPAVELPADDINDDDIPF